MKPPVVTAVLVVLVQVSQSFPALYHRGWWRLLKEGDSCGKCDLALCSEPKDCLAGTVVDHCGCCSECGNVEGQICDLDQGNHFYGQCGDNLECRLDADEARFGEVPEPQCVCKSQESICGSDGKTYENICQFNKAYATKRNISMKHKGPCESAPVISMPPQDVQNFTGNDVIFGYDAHISVQARGGPQKYGVTGWLQIQGLKKSDEGIYICHTKNKYGNAEDYSHRSETQLHYPHPTEALRC
uniref:Ovomucoid n=1 Tax=Meleagris gallopavo TaxID=9103 RepID=G1MSN5_MELGA